MWVVTVKQRIILPSFPPDRLDPWVRARCRKRRQSRITSHPVAASSGCTNIPHTRGFGLGKAGPILLTACLSQSRERSAYPDPTRLIRPRGLRRPMSSAWPIRSSIARLPAPRLD
jgi:hypothetical protein